MAESSEHLRGPDSPSEASEDARKEKQDTPAPGSGSLPGPAPPTQYPPPMIFAVNMFALYISIFCVALDNTIISTAIPQITDQFHALDDVGWYGSGRSPPFALDPVETPRMLMFIPKPTLSHNVPLSYNSASFIACSIQNGSS